MEKNDGILLPKQAFLSERLIKRNYPSNNNEKAIKRAGGLRVMNSGQMHELVRMVPEVKNLLKKLSKCTMEQANNVSKSRLIL